MTTKRKQRNSNNERNNIVPISYKTDNQRDYILSVVTNDITICTGPSGTGKSFCACGIAAEKLHDGQFEKIIITRPLEPCGKELGSLPGEVQEKIMPYLKPAEENLKFFLRNYYGLYFNDSRIKYEPLELMRGCTFNNTIMILDEAQNCSIDQIKMFITRMGDGSKVIINGDIDQTDIQGRSGLSYCFNKLSKVKGVGCVKLTTKDIQRNGILGRVLDALEDRS